jgi:hypothetical protein
VGGLGSNFSLVASGALHLSAELASQNVNSGDDLVLSTTTLAGGDATNDNQVNINDLSCIGGAYNPTVASVGDCANNGSTDVTGDGFTNIFDLTLAGGNFLLVGPRPW